MAPTPLTLALCLYPSVTTADFADPIELLGFISPKYVAKGVLPHSPAFSITVTSLAPSTNPVVPFAGPTLLPDRAYDDVGEGEQFDLILVPGGETSATEDVPESLIRFLRRQAPGAKHVLSVCTGAEITARAGLLTGLRATTNKADFRRIKAKTVAYGPITWVPQARWVVDGNDRIWTSSGVTAGADMTYAFLISLVGKEVAEFVRGVVELSIHEQGQDEFAAFWGLV